MKKSIVLITVIITAIIVSCKKQEENSTPAEEKKPTTFNVKIDLQTNNDVDIILYYKDGSKEWFVDDKTVWFTAKANKEFQVAEFNLPEGTMPLDFRLDIGRNEFKGQEPVTIRYFSMNYLDRTFTIPQDLFGTFFKCNNYITYDAATKKYSFSKDDKGNYDPYFESTPLLYPQIANVAMAKAK